MARILAINPNSNEDVTEGMRDALTGIDGGPVEIECATLPEGPFGIETQADVEAVVAPLRAMVRRRSDCAAFVIACYSDPGLAECRAAVAAPVFGIQESGVLTTLQADAMRDGGRFGVVALGPQSIERHMRCMGAMGVLDRLAGERPLHLSVAEAERPEAFARILEVAAALRDDDGARAVLLGCAGMSRHRAALEDALGVPVIDPTQAAVAQALAAVRRAAAAPQGAAV